jgi:hypothetical protein
MYSTFLIEILLGTGLTGQIWIEGKGWLAIKINLDKDDLSIGMLKKKKKLKVNFVFKSSISPIIEVH